MADKEATVYIVDVGRCMKEKNNGRDQSDLDWAMTYVWEKITSTVATERKTATVGVVGLRTHGTDNDLAGDEGYENISCFQPISQILLPELKQLYETIKCSNTNDGDAISGIVVAIEMIAKYTKKLKYRRKIVLVTNGNLSIDEEGIDDIARKISGDSIELVVLGVDFDDAEYGFKEEDKDPLKADSERTLKRLVDGCDGVYGTLVQAIDELSTPRLKTTRPVHTFRGQLTLGNPDEYDSAMVIDVERYPKVMVRKTLSASNYIQRPEFVNGNDSMQSSATVKADPEAENGVAPVRNERMYQIDDPTSAGGKRDVQRDNLEKGYEYGRTAVFISESDWNVTKLETTSSMDIIGFIPWSTYDRSMHMSVSSIIIGQKTNPKAIMALSSLIHALFELESYAVARLVKKDGNDPTILLLAPSIEVDYECLLDVALPFAEDVRPYRFPPLDRVITVSGKTITEHRHLPTDALQKTMSDYVDRMDLDNFAKDEEGNDTEGIPIEETFSPLLHRIDQAVRWRAVHPNEPIPPPYDILTRYTVPPKPLLDKSKHRLDKLIQAADVKRVPPKTLSRRTNRQATKPLSGLDLDALLGPKLPPSPPPHSSTATTSPSSELSVDPSNPIPSFRQALDAATSLPQITSIAHSFLGIIESHINSFGGKDYDRAIEELGVLREEMIELEEPRVYNEVVRGLKRKLVEGGGGERRDFWYMVGKGRVGLIVTEKGKEGGGGGGGDADGEEVTEEEARGVLRWG